MGAVPIVTIQVDDDLLARAQQLAAARKMTVSEMLERVLRVVAAPPLNRSQLPPATRQALGMLPPMSDEVVERVLDEERMRKYG
jgi:antitoxin component of RelBE/YafQ-DinJ toxin-antitoxin module